MTVTTADRIHELRFYRVAAGREADMVARVQQDLRWLLPRHDIRPNAGWMATSGPDLPAFIYIMPFSSMLERDRCWRGFYGDPDWQEVRNRTNAGSELVEDYEIWFVRELTAWNDAPPPGGIDELVISRTLVGKSAQAAAALRESELPALKRAGATILGAFDIVSGSTLPGAAIFLRWPDWETRAAARAALAGDPTLTERRKQEIGEFGTALIGRGRSHLMDEVPVEWQTPVR